MYCTYNVMSNIFGSHIWSYIGNLNSLDNVCANINGPYYIACVFCLAAFHIVLQNDLTHILWGYLGCTSLQDKFFSTLFSQQITNIIFMVCGSGNLRIFGNYNK